MTPPSQSQTGATARASATPSTVVNTIDFADMGGGSLPVSPGAVTSSLPEDSAKDVMSPSESPALVFHIRHYGTHLAGLHQLLSRREASDAAEPVRTRRRDSRPRYRDPGGERSRAKDPHLSVAGRAHHR